MVYAVRIIHLKLIVNAPNQWIVLLARSDWLLKLGRASAIHLPAFFWISRASRFPHFSKKEQFWCWLSPGLEYTKTIIHLNVDEEWQIFTSNSVNNC